jgi:hypothetical protein
LPLPERCSGGEHVSGAGVPPFAALEQCKADLTDKLVHFCVGFQETKVLCQAGPDLKKLGDASRAEASLVLSR